MGVDLTLVHAQELHLHVEGRARPRAQPHALDLVLRGVVIHGLDPLESVIHGVSVSVESALDPLVVVMLNTMIKIANAPAAQPLKSLLGRDPCLNLLTVIAISATARKEARRGAQAAPHVEIAPLPPTPIKACRSAQRAIKMTLKSSARRRMSRVKGVFFFFSLFC